MTDVRVASFNVENLFARPRAFNAADRAAGEAAVQAHAEFNALSERWLLDRGPRADGPAAGDP